LYSRETQNAQKTQKDAETATFFQQRRSWGPPGGQKHPRRVLKSFCLVRSQSARSARSARSASAFGRHANTCGRVSGIVRGEQATPLFFPSQSWRLRG